MFIGIVGKANVGKSTLFNALTLAGAQMANYPFTTIDPNKGIAFATAPCPHVALSTQCNPRNGKCANGTRLVPINVVDVAGLVPGAHEGRGRGNQFLNDLSAADALIVVVDASGGTDDEGVPVEAGTHDPCRDVEFLEEELDYWFLDVIKRNAAKAKGKLLSEFVQLLSGLKITDEVFKHAMRELGLIEKFDQWGKDEFLELAKALRKATKPLTIAANKLDSPFAEKNLAVLKERFPDYKVFGVAADAELALRKAEEKQWIAIKYEGDKEHFDLLASELNPQVKAALDKIDANILKKFGSTGVRQLMNETAFNLLGCIVVYPVEDEKKYSNHFGQVLPDAILLPRGSNVHDLAEKIHSDLAKGLLYAVDARKQMRIAKDHILQNGDVIKIVSAR